MRTKLALLATTALAALAIATPANAAGWYLNISGGANWLNDSQFANIAADTVNAALDEFDAFDFNNNPEAGYVISGAVGFSLGGMMPGLRVEAEVGYRHNEVDGLWASTNDTSGNNGAPTADSGALDYDHTTLSVLANVWYDFDVAGVKPYFGGGVGWADVELDGTYIGGAVPSFTYSDSGFAWQLGGGVNFQVAPNIQLGVGYRYMEGPEITVLPPFLAENIASGVVDSNNHSGVVSLTFGM